jgi:excisionase family DNA binding protein
VVGDLLSTGEAAKRIGVARGTLARWRQEGRVTPTMTTAGGQARWDLDDLKRQLRKQPPPDEA